MVLVRLVELVKLTAAVACNSNRRMTHDVELSYTNINNALTQSGVRGESPIEPDGTSKTS